MCVCRSEDAAVSGKAQVKLFIAYSSDENRLVINVHACRYVSYTLIKQNREYVYNGMCNGESWLLCNATPLH